MITVGNFMSINRNFVIFAFIALAVFFSALSCNGCGTVPTNEYDPPGSGIPNLNDPAPKQKADAVPLPVDATPEQVWRNRCGECHAPEFGIGKYKGEQWEPVIAKMIAKEDAHFTPKLAEQVYKYLYERTKNDGDPPWSEVIAGRSQFGNEGGAFTDRRHADR